MPFRRFTGRCFPADSWLPGHIPAQEARCAASGKYPRTSAPISEMTAAAASGPMPGMVVSRSRAARKGCHHRLDLRVQLREHALPGGRGGPGAAGTAWRGGPRTGPPAPSTGPGSSTASGRCARSASTAPRRSPSISASIIGRPDFVAMEEATESILMPASCSTFPSRGDLAGPLLGDLRPVADHVPGRLDVRRGDEAARQQPALQQLRQPLRVRHVRLPPARSCTCPALHTSTFSKSPCSSSAW